MPRRSIPVIIIILLASTTTFLVTSYQLPVTKDKNVLSNEVYVSARVGNYYIDVLTGWTSPFAEVTLSGKKLIRKTTADNKGYFQFSFIPVFDDLGELCLVSQDVNLLPSYPVCLPSPETNKNIEIKDVYLPPTISVESDKIPSGKTAKASGMTTPNTEVDVHLFSENDGSLAIYLPFQIPLPEFLTLKSKTNSQNENNKPKNLSFQKSSVLNLNLFEVKTAYAVGLPKYEVKSNENGYFEFSLPASAPSKNGFFANTSFSPKSNTLYFETLGLWGLFKLFLENLIKEFIIFLTSIKSNPAKIILLEILTLFGLVNLFLFSKIKDNRQKNSQSLNKKFEIRS